MALGLVWSLPRVAPVPASAGHPLARLAEGARFVWNHAYLQPIVITAILFNTAWFCLQGVYVAYAVSRLGMSAAQVGRRLRSMGSA